MIHDATVEVTCDGPNCTNSVTVEPEYVYNDYTGTSGHYDTKDSSIARLLDQEGWVVEDDKQYCDWCRPEEEDEEDDDE